MNFIDCVTAQIKKTELTLSSKNRLIQQVTKRYDDFMVDVAEGNTTYTEQGVEGFIKHYTTQQITRAEQAVRILAKERALTEDIQDVADNTTPWLEDFAARKNAIGSLLGKEALQPNGAKYVSSYERGGAFAAKVTYNRTLNFQYKRLTEYLSADGIGTRMFDYADNVIREAYSLQSMELARFLTPVAEDLRQHRDRWLGMANSNAEMELVVRYLIDGQAPKGLSSELKAFGDNMRKSFDRVQTALQAEGVNIGYVKNYFPVVHDSGRVRGAEAATWIRDIDELIDHSRIIDYETNAVATTERRLEILQNAYESIVTNGVYTRALDGSKKGLSQGNAELWSSVTQSRVFHFVDSDAYLAYLRKYGPQTTLRTPKEGQPSGELMPAFFGYMYNVSAHLANVKTFGLNPQNFIERVAPLTNKSQSTRGSFYQVVGHPDTTDWSSAQEYTLAIANMIQANVLSGVLLSMPPDYAFYKSANRSFGMDESQVNFIKTWGANFKSSSMDGANTLKEVDQLSHVVSIAANASMQRSVYTASGDEGVSGQMGVFRRFSELQRDAVMRAGGAVSGQEALVSVSRLTLVSTWGSYLDRYSFDDLRSLKNDFYNQFLLRVGDQAAWDALREVPLSTLDNKPDMPTLDTQAILMHAASLDDPLDQALYNQLADKVHAFNEDYVRSVTGEADPMTRYITSIGQSPGTWGLIGGKLAMMLKTWMITQYRNHALPVLANTPGIRGLFGDQSRVSWNATSEKYWGSVLHLGVSATALGLMTLVLRDLANNREPRVFSEEANMGELLLEAFLSGGGGGLLADIALIDPGQYGQTVGATLIGPVGSALNSAFGLGAKPLYDLLSGEDDIGDAWRKDLITAGIRWSPIPITNLWYIRKLSQAILTEAGSQLVYQDYADVVQEAEQRFLDEHGIQELF